MSIFTGLGNAVGNLFSLPGDYINAYSAALKSIPQNRAYQQALMQAKLGLFNQFQGGMGGQPQNASPYETGKGIIDAGPTDQPFLPNMGPPQGSPTPRGGPPNYDAMQGPLAGLALLGDTGAGAAANILKPPDPQWTQGSGGDWVNAHGSAQPGRSANPTVVGNTFGSRIMDLNDPSSWNQPIVNSPSAGAQWNPSTAKWELAPGAAATIQAGAAASSAGTEAPKAALDLVQVPLGPGGSMITMPRDEAARRLRGAPVPGANVPPPPVGAGPPRGVNNGPVPGFGVSQSTADRAFDAADATKLSDQIAADTGAREGALSTRQQSQQSLAFLASHKTDVTTGAKIQLAQLIRSIPGLSTANIDNYASEGALYKQALQRQIATSAKSIFPTRITNVDIKLAGTFNPTTATPNETAQVFYANQAAVAARQVARADFASSYQGPKSRQAFEAAWANGAGRKSLFQDPVWSSVTIGGKPVVTYYNYKGQKYGLVNMGGGTPQPFRVVQ